MPGDKPLICRRALQVHVLDMTTMNRRFILVPNGFQLVQMSQHVFDIISKLHCSFDQKIDQGKFNFAWISGESRRTLENHISCSEDQLNEVQGNENGASGKETEAENDEAVAEGNPQT
ncbi:hypothetical protein M5689_000275 [Euphorbia peplus]|nr:hypothetical protein M5689_000275 [Euphorbia peplus]